MLMFLGIVFLVLAVVAFFVEVFAEGMETAPKSHLSDFALAIVFLALAAACFVLRHFLHGRAIAW